jgi:hypothetical protein
MAMRVGIPALMGVSTLSGFVAPGNPLDTIARTGIQAGAHAIVASTLGVVYPWAAAGYVGFAGLNMLRPGDNWGPF